jgi:CheY-like chemotaxis protein
MTTQPRPATTGLTPPLAPSHLERTVPETLVRVLVVDDTDAIRTVVTLALELDGRYQVVGSAVDGVEGVTAAEELQPDIVLLDRSMPRMDGITALPRIRTVAPGAAVVLYTSDTDAGVHQAAMTAGALDVMDKGASLGDIGAILADVLVRSASDEADEVAVQVGPVPSSAALAWITNTKGILDAVRRAGEVTDQAIEDEVLDTFTHYLDVWEAVAGTNPEFLWAARAPASEVERLVEAWASIDRIDDDRLHELGVDWSSSLGRSFFDALTAAVLRALTAHDNTVALAQRLEPQWAPPQARGEG